MTNLINEIGTVTRELRDSHLALVQVWVLAPDFEDNSKGIELWDMAEYAESLWGGYEFFINGTIYTVVTDRKLYNKCYNCHI